MRSFLAIDSSLGGIAGIPLAMLTIPNTSSSPLDIGPTTARTLYAVASTSAQSNDTAVANIGASSNNSNSFEGAQVIRSTLLGEGGLRHRGQVIGGSTIYQNLNLGWPWGVPLAVCGWWDGSRFGFQGYRSAPIISAPSASGSMNTTPLLRMASIASNGTTPIAALAYRGVHDLDTRTRILSWLMQRYGNI